MLFSSLNPAPDGKGEFSFACLHDIPAESGCYALAAYNGAILYIGQAKNLRNRMEQHLREDAKRQNTPHGVAFWMHYKKWDAIQLDGLERGWMQQHQFQEQGARPFFNKIDAPT